MARLPTAESLGGLQRVGAPGGRVASVRTGAVAEGAISQARAVSDLGSTVQSIGAQFQERQNKEDEYNSELAFQEFKFATQNGLVSAIDTVTPDKVSGFTQEYQQNYQKSAKTFLAGIPDSQKQRIDQKLFELERDVAVKARDFQREELGRVSLNNLNTIGDNVSAQARTVRNNTEFGDLISGLEDVVRKDPNLNPREKVEALKAVSKKAATAYLDSREPTERAAIIKGELARRRGGSPVGSVTDRIVHVESRGRVKATNPNSSAAGPGQFLDDTWLETIQKHRPDILQGRTRQEVLDLRTRKEFQDLSIEMTQKYQEDNARFLESRGLPVRPGTLYLAHFAGPGGAAKVLSANPNAPASSVFSSTAIEANAFLKGKTVGEVVAWADNKMGGHEATALSTFSDAQLSSILEGATKQEIARLKAEQEAAEKAAEETRKLGVDQLRSNIFERKADEDTVLEERKRGLFKDHKEFESVLKYAREIAEGERDSELIREFITGKKVYNPADKTHSAAFNNLYDKSDANEKLMNQDEATADNLVRMFGEFNSAPKSAIGTLSHMVQSQDKNSVVYALQTLDRMRRTSPEAFEKAVTDKYLKRKVEFLATQGAALAPNQVVERLQKMDDPHQEAVRKKRKEDAEKLVLDVTPEDVIEKLDLDTVLEFSDPTVAPSRINTNPTDTVSIITRQYRELFIEEFAENGGNAELAETMALRQLGTIWQRSDATGNARIMKNPPEAHLPDIGVDDPYGWIREDLQRDLKLHFTAPREAPSGETIASPLTKLPDNISLVPVDRFNPASPAWNVVYQDANGEVQVLLGTDGLPYRQVFDPTPHQKKELANYNRRRALRKREISPETVDTIMR